MFLVLTKKMSSKLDECWSLLEMESSEVGSSSSSGSITAGSSSAAAALPAPAPLAQPAALPAPAKRSADPPPTKKPRKSEPAVKKEKDDKPGKDPASLKEKILVADMNRAKAQIQKQLASAELLEGQIKTNASYTWARNDQNLGSLQQAIRNLRSEMSPFHAEFMVCEPKMMRDKFGQMTFQKEGESFMLLSKWVGDLQTAEKTIKKRHAVRV